MPTRRCVWPLIDRWWWWWCDLHTRKFIHRMRWHNRWLHSIRNWFWQIRFFAHWHANEMRARDIETLFREYCARHINCSRAAIVSAICTSSEVANAFNFYFGQAAMVNICHGRWAYWLSWIRPDVAPLLIRMLINVERVQCPLICISKSYPTKFPILYSAIMRHCVDWSPDPEKLENRIRIAAK